MFNKSDKVNIEQFNNLKKEVDDLQNNVEKGFTQINNSLSKINESLIKLDSKVESLDSKVERIDKDLVYLKGTKDGEEKAKSKLWDIGKWTVTLIVGTGALWKGIDIIVYFYTFLSKNFQ